MLIRRNINIFNQALAISLVKQANVVHLHLPIYSTSNLSDKSRRGQHRQCERWYCFENSLGKNISKIIHLISFSHVNFDIMIYQIKNVYCPLTLKVRNCLEDYKRCIHILNRILNLARTKSMELTLEQQFKLSVLYRLCHACGCTDAASASFVMVLAPTPKYSISNISRINTYGHFTHLKYDNFINPG